MQAQEMKPFCSNSGWQRLKPNNFRWLSFSPHIDNFYNVCNDSNTGLWLRHLFSKFAVCWIWVSFLSTYFTALEVTSTFEWSVCRIRVPKLLCSILRISTKASSLWDFQRNYILVTADRKQLIAMDKTLHYSNPIVPARIAKRSGKVLFPPSSCPTGDFLH